jgi:hypothetical protein
MTVGGKSRRSSGITMIVCGVIILIVD